MIFANKKITVNTKSAQQTAKIIANVKNLESKNLIQFNGDTILLYPQIWKDKPSAINWIKCLYIYCNLKKKLSNDNALYFKNIETMELIGTMINKRAKVLLFS